MNFSESQTKQNLASAFSAECQAGARYQFMATLAQNEKLFYVQSTMKMLAKNEMAHAKLFYDYVVEKSKGSDNIAYEADYPFVEEDLEKCLCEETIIERAEAEDIYPEFAEIARREGFDDIAASFDVVAEVEKSHGEILDQLCKGYKKDALYKSQNKKIFKCSNCGHYEYIKEAWKKCPLCSLDQGYVVIDFAEAMQKACEA